VPETSNERWAELILVTAAGEVLGQLPALRAGSPWWPEVASVARAVHERYGLPVTILRLLAAERSAPPGGRVSYLAEVPAAHAAAARAVSSPCTLPAPALLGDHPLRNTYAKPGGPTSDLVWAERVLAQRGIPLAGAARQIKTWNLSSLWCLPVEGGRVWLKVVPGFFAHEGALIGAMPVGAPVPRLLGRDGPRLLMADIPGDDLFEAEHPTHLRMIELLVALQREFLGRTHELLALGLRDWRAPALIVAIRSVLERTRSQLGEAELRVLDAFANALDRRLAELDACGLPEGLVHGDFHPGNLRGAGAELTLLDWGDACVGHPLLDVPAFLSRAPVDRRSALEAHWVTLWRAALPGSDPARAWALSAALAAARQAVIYRHFLDHIEPSEQPYHRGDPADWLRRTASIVEAERT
jgi:hypothetical protein